ncbi:MAG: hypothetical protein K2X82_10325 [Gemmataceae bacterium]|nr:hypothetical protein [Gemmataceae bacterium]
MADTKTEFENLPDSLLWLADAPMFIDADQIGRFYDSVVRPANEEGTTTYSASEEELRELSTRFGTGVKVGLGGLFSFLGIGEANAKAEAGVQRRRGGKSAKGTTIELKPIQTPQRQLVQLTAHYLLTYPDRFFPVENIRAAQCRQAGGCWTDDVIKGVPRVLAFLNLPSLAEAEPDCPKTTLIPIAAEFANGTVVTYFDKFQPKPGGPPCPPHPDISEPATYAAGKKAYWKWFSDHFQLQPSINLIEESVREQKCRVQWIDFRVPISDEGDTLHLHIVGGGQYDTITFAYKFIRRGYEFGLRLVGTLKTDPGMNVLAIYER